MLRNKAQTITAHSRAWLLAAVLTFAGLGSSSTIAYAHGGYEHVMGTVQNVGANVISIKQTNGHTVHVGLDTNTAYMRGAEILHKSDVKTGDRVVIEASKHDSYLVAHDVKLGAAAKKAKSTVHPKHG